MYKVVPVIITGLMLGRFLSFIWTVAWGKQVLYFYKSSFNHQISMIPHEPSDFGVSQHQTMVQITWLWSDHWLLNRVPTDLVVLHIYTQFGLCSKYLYNKNFTVLDFIILITNRANFAVRGPSSLLSGIKWCAL